MTIRTASIKGAALAATIALASSLALGAAAADLEVRIEGLRLGRRRRAGRAAPAHGGREVPRRCRRGRRDHAPRRLRHRARDIRRRGTRCVCRGRVPRRDGDGALNQNFVACRPKATASPTARWLHGPAQLRGCRGNRGRGGGRAFRLGADRLSRRRRAGVRSMTAALSRRGVLRALGALPVALAAGRAGAAADSTDSEPALTAAQRRLAFATPPAEALAAPLTTHSGRLPPDLAGVLWRNGPAEHERFGHRYGHWFDGDGMVQAFTFSGDDVSHRAIILDTPKRRRETAAGRRLLPAFGTLPPGVAPIMTPDDMNAANTSVLAHGWAAHGALGGRLGAGIRCRDAGGRQLRRMAAGPRGRTLLGPTPRWRRTAPAGISAASPFRGRCCCSTASTRKAGSPPSTPCRSTRSAWSTTVS